VTWERRIEQQEYKTSMTMKEINRHFNMGIWQLGGTTFQDINIERTEIKAAMYIIF
jgi:hypothetical protein